MKEAMMLGSTRTGSLLRLNLALALGFFLTATALRAQVMPIAVLDFDGFGISESEAIALSNRLRNELFRLGTFQVVDRGMMQSILEEQDFQLTGCTSNECLVQVGKLIGAQQMVGGSVSKVGGTFTVSARLVDVETGTVLGVSDFDLRGELDDLLTTGMQQVALMLSGQEAAPQAPAPTVSRMVSPQIPRAPASRADMAQALRELPWQALVGIPAGEGGFGAEFSKFVGRGFPVGLFLVKPAVSLGYLMRTYEDTDDGMYYEDMRGYLSAALHADMSGVKFGGSIYTGFGLSVGQYWEGIYNSFTDDYDTYWTSEGMETVFQLGGQVRIPVSDKYKLIGDTRIVVTPTYEASFMFQVGIQR
jgi:TolB-like protein